MSSFRLYPAPVQTAMYTRTPDATIIAGGTQLC